MEAVALLALLLATATRLPVPAFARIGDSGDVHQNVPARELLRLLAWWHGDEDRTVR